MKKKANEATIEELIKDVSSYEDPDQMLIISHDGNGNFTISDQEWKNHGDGDSLRAAILQYGQKKGVDQEFANLDWMA